MRKKQQKVVKPAKFPKELLDGLLAGYRTPEDITGPEGCSSSAPQRSSSGGSRPR